MIKAASQVALVTGANRGIGFAVVEGLLQRGITVILTSRNEKGGKAALAKLGTTQSHYHQLDITSSESVDRLVDFVATAFGRLDILVNNAGTNYDTW